MNAPCRNCYVCGEPFEEDSFCGHIRTEREEPPYAFVCLGVCADKMRGWVEAGLITQYPPYQQAAGMKEAPVYWKFESSEKKGIREAVDKFINSKPLSRFDAFGLRAYFIHWVDTPEWERLDADIESLARLRKSVRLARLDGELAHWYAEACKIGIDPL